MSLAEREVSLAHFRASLWDAARRAFRAAHQARVWVIREDPTNKVLRMQEQFQTMLKYERSRRTPRSPPTTPTRRTSRIRRRPAYAGFSVSWMGADLEDLPPAGGPYSQFHQRKLLARFDHLV